MSFTERAGLIPVLLLTGCAQQTVYTGPPSGSVVDSMLSRSAADISAMQYRVHQTGPSAQRPVSPAAKPVKAFTPGAASGSALTVKPASAPPASATGAGPADGFIRQDGAAPTLRAALRKIVPPGQTVVFDKTVSADAPELWRWTGNDRWPYVADKMLSARGLKATLNDKTHTVTIAASQHAQALPGTGKSAVPLVPAASAVKATPAGNVKSGNESSTGRNPFRGNKAAVTGVVPVTPVNAVAPAPVLRVWKIEKGTTLRQGYEQWVSQEVCASDKPKWTVRWDTGTNYPIDYTLTFHAANFEDATAQLFTLWHSAQVPLFVSGYRQQCLVVISDAPPGAVSATPNAAVKETR
ncbi:TcpQ domain-containing protein [Type-D symbiont of Plautia stali]|uniref:TcpQ domain-containing protein n=1 Tax=Type-D symbiont of Plautia stali TaxID=1560356 RepID=UPI00073F577E|nr:TcpQ domain-containing protein [Type-D symbiont of Plautia stali]